MNPQDNIEKLITELVLPGTKADDERILNDALAAYEKSETKKTAEHQPIVWRMIMNKPITKLAAAAVIIIAVVISINLLDKTIAPAYAIEQTIEAFKNVRFLHIIRHNKSGEIEDERWIEVKPDGTQGRYRQDTAGKLLVVDNGQNSFVYHYDKNTVLFYGKNGPNYTWISNIHQFFRDMAGDNSVNIEENVDYNGQKAHLVRWLKLNIECYIDPDTKLPIALGQDEIYYEEPEENIFQIPETPEIVTVVDKRNGTEQTKEPEWVKNQDEAQKTFDDARVSLANGRFDEAVKLFKEVFQLEGTGRNWAWFWLGQAYYKLGKYDAAVEAYTKVIEMFKRHNITPHYAHLARGFAYRAKGIEEVAWKDFKVALPIMINALRNIQGTRMFDYADDSLNKGKESSDQERFDKMILRLEEITGKDSAYDPNEDKEKNIYYWERWWEKIASK